MANPLTRPVLDRDPIDRLIVMAAALLDAPIAAIAMDIGGSRVLRSVRAGLVTDRDQGECGETPLEMGPDGTLVILDLQNDPQTATNMFVQGPAHCRFYAGALIKDAAGHRIGSLCVLDTVERGAPPASVMRLLRMLADQAASAVDQLNLMQGQEEKAELLHLAESLLGLGHWRFDFLTGQITWSDEVYRIHGLDRATFDPVLHDALAAYHPDDRPIIKGHVEHARVTGQGYDCKLRLLRPDGSERLTQSTGRCLMGDDGAPIALFGVFQDITDKHAAERRLRESEERFRLLASNATDIVTECDLDGRFRYVSPAVTTVTGYTEDEVVGKRALDFVHPDDRARVEQELGRALRSPGVTQIEHRHIRKDGEVIWVQSRPRLAFDPVTGKPCAVTDVMRDVTIQKAAEAQLHAARAAADEASQVKSDFLANMSHEIRTPLTAILGFSSLLTNRDDVPEDAQVHIGRIARASQSLLSIVNDVLDFSKLEAGQYELHAEACDPLVVCHEALLMFAPLAQEKGISLDFGQAGELPARVDLDPHRLRQILVNLVGNAIKFTDAGCVGMSVSYDTATSALAVTVRDTGAGMDEAQSSRLFQRFSQVDASSTRKHGGTGLGLAICKGLSEAMGGTISVTSIRGSGSVFSFTVAAPIIEVEAKNEKVISAGAGIDLDGLRLLVVDDNPANREIVAVLMGGLGVDVSEASSGGEAISISGQMPFDIILMDLRMPGLSGSEAAAAIKSIVGPNQSVPILGFSADTQVKPADKAVFDGLIAKPIILPALIEAISSGLRGPTAAAEASFLSGAA